MPCVVRDRLCLCRARIVADGDLPASVEVTHRSLFDGTIQGIRLEDRPVFSVQYHPEASPGPMDSSYLFDRFLAMIRGG